MATRGGASPVYVKKKRYGQAFALQWVFHHPVLFTVPADSAEYREGSLKNGLIPYEREN